MHVSCIVKPEKEVIEELLSKKSILYVHALQYTHASKPYMKASFINYGCMISKGCGIDLSTLLICYSLLLKLKKWLCINMSFLAWL